MVLEEVAEEVIDECFRALVYAGVPESSLEEIIHTRYYSSPAYQQAIEQICDHLFDVVADEENGAVRQWDFDCTDELHLVRYPQPKTPFTLDWNPPMAWHPNEKRGILFGITRCFNWLCRQRVQETVRAFKNARNAEELDGMLKKAVEIGILVKKDCKICHNHSISGSHHAWNTFVRRAFELSLFVGHGAAPMRSEPPAQARPPINERPMPETFARMEPDDYGHDRQGKPMRKHSDYKRAKDRVRGRRTEDFDDE